MPANVFDREGTGYLVVRNARGQHSLWPDSHAVPTGWQTISDERTPCGRAAAMALVDSVWPDVREVTGASPDVPTLPELFERTAARHARALAVEEESDSLTYAQLAERVNRLARVLIARGLGPGDLVGLSVPRGIPLAVAALAVVTSGAAYVPLDPGYPTERIVHMLADSGIGTVVRGGNHQLPVGRSDPAVIDLDDRALTADVASRSGTPVGQSERRRRLDAVDLMYVIYTSGSTGAPKGVAVPHAGMKALVAAQQQWIGPGPGDRVLQWASFSFDAGFWDMTLALLSGATLVLTDDRAVLPGEELHRTLVQRRITHAVLPPVALSVTDPTGVLPGGVVLSTGDSCPASLVNDWAPGRRMFNGYGPTEMTVGVTMAGPVRAGAQVSIGVPWPGNEVRVLDEELAPCAPGVEGELFLVGAGEALGYLYRSGLTAARFVADPYGEPGDRMYRSGDVGYRAESGELYFTGRADQQVKLRGFRVELGEVEAAAEESGEVRLSAAVVTGSLEAARLVAFVVADPSAETAGRSDALAERLRQRLSRRLPAPLVPARIVVLPELPMTKNGKVDRHELARRAAKLPPGGSTHEAGASKGPADDPVGALCDLAARLLEVPAVQPHDNFFERGGHSVLAVKLAKCVRDDWGISLSVRAVFERPTMAELSEMLHAS